MSSAIPTDPATIVIFGGSGDLSKRKLVPALFELHRERQLPPATAIVGYARTGESDETYRTEMKAAVAEFARTKPVDEAEWSSIRLPALFLPGRPDDCRRTSPTSRCASSRSRRNGASPGTGSSTSRSRRPAIGVVVTQPRRGGSRPPGRAAARGRASSSRSRSGTTSQTARALNEELAHVFRESQIFRIDHYLGKETTQNILVFRFGNGIFEPLWNRRYVDHVQITVAESIGVEGRGKFYEEAGVLRDIVQNHVLQLLCLVAMEPPVAFEPNAVRDEKVKVLAVHPAAVARGDPARHACAGSTDRARSTGSRSRATARRRTSRRCRSARRTRRGRCRSTTGGGPACRSTCAPASGCRSASPRSRSSSRRRRSPSSARSASSRQEPNVLVLRIQPDEGDRPGFGAKVPGPDDEVDPVTMDFRYRDFFGASQPEAYERLLLDAMHGDSTLFARRDEVEAAWEHVTPLLDVWRDNPPLDHPNYEAGTWGPDAAVALLARDGRRWRRP